ncbi:MAG: flagellar hook-length control protein FliK [Chloroflexota bacterium]|nr:flagellar hook-length control protein FliK [Chloroflexota bacterium]
MNVELPRGLLSVRPLDAGQAQALRLNVGQQLFATIVDLLDDRALVDLGGGLRLPAGVRTAEQLRPGQVVRLQVAEVSPEHIALQLLPPETTPAPASDAAVGQFLIGLGLPDDALDREALAALVSQSQPVTVESLTELRALALSLQAVGQDELRALAFSLARRLQATPATLQVVRQGLGSSGQAPPVAERARQLASQLLASLGPADRAESQLAAGLRDLLAQLPPAAPDGPPAPEGLRWLMEQTIATLERQLAVLVDGFGAGGPSAETSGQGAATAASVAAESAAQGGAPAGTLASDAASDSTSQPAAIATPQPADEKAAGAAAGNRDPVASVPPAPAPRGGLVRSAQFPPRPAAEELLVATETRPNVKEAVPPAGSERPTAPTPASDPPPLPRLELPANRPEGVQSQLTARQLLAHLEQSIASDQLSPAQLPVAASLRDSLQQLVQVVQFHQLQNVAGAGPNAGLGYLTFPIPLGDGRTFTSAELRVSYREGTRGRRIDPEDVHLVFQLDMAHLRRVTISLHVHHRQMSCAMEAETAEVERLLSGASPELRTSLEGLGYAVQPIRCALGPSRGRASSASARPGPGPGQVDVQV